MERSDQGRLVLGRRVGQTLRIGEAVVEVVTVRRGVVRLCVTAPASVHILRGELEAGDQRERGAA